MRATKLFRMLDPKPWVALGLLLGLVGLILAYSSYAHVSVVQARKLTVRGKPAVQLIIQTDQGPGKEIIVQVGANKITFQTDARGRVDTGHMEIPPGATTVEVQMPQPGDEFWPSECTIPLAEIPENEFKRVEACMDLEPPITQFSQSPLKNRYGWNNSEVTVALEATDTKSGVKQVCYELSGAQAQGLRCVEGSRAEFAIPKSPNGVTTISFFSEDRWVDQGTPKPNRESPEEDVVRIDTGPPSISGYRSLGPNEHGWNNQPVRVSFSCSDGLSGIASCSGDRTISSEGANQSVSGYAEDKAGNTSSTTVYVSIDLTKPVIRQAGSGACSLAGNASWCRGEITVPFEATDNLSGFPPDGRRTIRFTQSTAEEGSSVMVSSGKVEDLAGNAADPISAGPFKIDGIPPGISCQVPDTTLWYREDVSVPCTASDATSGLANPADVSFVLKAQGEGASISTGTRTVADIAGNTATAGPFSFKIDKTPPTISLSASSPAPGEPAVISWEIADALSGVDPESCLVTISGPGITGVGGRQTLSTDCHGQVSLTFEQLGAGTFTVRTSARDLAGNEGSGEQLFTIPEPYCAIEGQVVDATTRWPIMEAQVYLSPTDRSTTTDVEGRFSFTKLMPGTYTVTAEATGYSPSSRDVECRAGEIAEVVLALSPLGNWRIVLTWGRDPADLDSHLWTPDGEHIWYMHMEGENANLDVDDTDSFGPETITIQKLVEGTYVYAVKHYAGAGNLAHSEAQVEVFSPAELVRRFTNPSCSTGEGSWWVVFKLHVAHGHVEIEEVNGCLEHFPENSPTPPPPVH